MVGYRSSLAVVLTVCAVVLVLASGCGQKAQFELSPKFTRSIHPVDAKDAHILSPDNYQKVVEGMTQDQVRAVFGTTAPTVTGYKPEEEYELVWEHAGKEIVVRFRGDKVVTKSQKGVVADGQ